MLNRFLAGKEADKRGPKARRPYLATECSDLNEADKWRQQILREIGKKVMEIQNAGLGEHRCVLRCRGGERRHCRTTPGATGLQRSARAGAGADAAAGACSYLQLQLLHNPLNAFCEEICSASQYLAPCVPGHAPAVRPAPHAAVHLPPPPRSACRPVPRHPLPPAARVPSATPHHQIQPPCPLRTAGSGT